MATVDVFASIDVDGIIDQFKNEIINYYGGTDPTQNPDGKPDVIKKLKEFASKPYTIGYYDSSILPSYTRLISSKRNTIGYKITQQDIVNGYLTNTYNLSISVANKDTIRWWGHTINPSSHLQAIISNIKVPLKPTTPPEFGTLIRKNPTFYFASKAIDINDLSKGIISETNSCYCIQGTLSATSGQIIPYDVEILILSHDFDDPDLGHIALPIVKVVVDPTVRVN